MTIDIANHSDSDAIAPLIVVEATHVAAGHETTQVLAGGLDTLPGALPPEYQGSVGLIYPPDPKAAGVRSDFTLSVVNPSLTPIDWDSQKASLRPSTIPADAWDAVWPNFRAVVGDTLADLYALLTPAALGSGG